MAIMKNLTLLLIFFSVSFAGVAQKKKTTEKKLTTIILIRHAEKATEPASDPGLTSEGQKRAEILAQILEKTTVDLIYSTPFERTRQTVKPLAESKFLRIDEYNPFKMEEVIELIKANAGKTIVFSGHSNTTPILLNQITGISSYKQLDEKDYDNLYIVTITKVGHGSITELQYGEPSIF